MGVESFDYILLSNVNDSMMAYGNCVVISKLNNYWLDKVSYSLVYMVIVGEDVAVIVHDGVRGSVVCYGSKCSCPCLINSHL